MFQVRDAQVVLDRDFLEVRSRILDIAAALDRLDRANFSGSSGPPIDRRLTQIRQAIEALLESKPGRSETVQQIFSLDYDSEWLSQMGLSLPTDRV